jgi:tol-pal system protein YbgF
VFIEMFLRQGSRSLVCTAVLASGCASFSTDGTVPIDQQVNDINARLTRVERVVNNDSLMDILARMDQLQAELQSIRNDVETLQHDTEMAGQRQRELYLDVDGRLQGIEKAALAAGAGAVAVYEGSALAPGQLPLPGGSDRENYDAAFELLKEGRYEEAASAFEQFMAVYPESTLMDNAQYWLAETYYVTQDYAAALPAFQKVISKHPGSRKVPDALLKIGYSNYALSKWAAARKSLTAVATNYPETTAARLAGQRLDQMKNEGH